MTGIVAVALATLLGYGDGNRVDSRADLTHLRGGWPFDHLTQDASALDPPLPATVDTASPWESPTDYDPGWWLADMAVLWLTQLALAAGIVQLVRSQAEEASTQRSSSAAAAPESTA